MLKTIFITALIALCIERYIRYRQVFDLDVPDVVYHHYPGPCKRVTGTGGSEDITVLPNGIAFVSSGMFPSYNGRILTLDLTGENYKLTELTIKGDSFNQSSFHPHGISYWIDKNSGDITLMVVNHPPEGDAVEVFKFDEKSWSLDHVKSITSSLFTWINDLVMTSENSFYVTKMFQWKQRTMVWLEVINAFRWGEILFYDGTRARSVADGLFGTNGINLSPDNTYLHVAEFGAKSVTTFEVLPSRDIRKIQSTLLHSGVDNIEVDKATGDLWIGCHPLVHRIVAYDEMHGKNATAPSQVLKARVKDGKIYDVVEVFKDPGNTIPASTVATVYGGKLIIGSLASAPLVCELKYVG